MEILYPCGLFKYSAIDRHFAQTIPLLNKLVTVAEAANTGTILGEQSRLTFPECAAVAEKSLSREVKTHHWYESKIMSICRFKAKAKHYNDDQNTKVQKIRL